MKILVKTLSVNNKTNKTIYLTDMVKLNSLTENFTCPDDKNLTYDNPIEANVFLSEYDNYFDEQNKLIQSLNAVNLQPLKPT